MRSLLLAILMGGAAAAAIAQTTPAQTTPAQTTPAQTTPLHAGPAYTRSESDTRHANEPVYPEFDVVVPMDPKLAASAYVRADWQVDAPGTGGLQATTVRRFADTGYGLSVILLLDVSGSMKGSTLDHMRNSITRFVDQAQPQDRVAVATIADETRWDVPFTAQPAEVKAGIAALATRGHETHLYDGMLDAMDHFVFGMPQRRVLLVISDGHDEGSTHTLDDVVAAASQHGIAIETIGLTHSDPKYLASLQQIASATGGSYAPAQSEDELDQLIGSGVDALKQSPVVRSFARISGPIPMAMPIKLTWKPQNMQWVAEMDSVPDFSYRPQRQRQWLWLAGGALLLVLLLAGVLVTRRKSKMKRVAYATTPAPMPLVAEPIAPPPPIRRETEFIKPVPAIPVDEPLPLRRTAAPTPEPPSLYLPGLAPTSRPTRLAHTFADDPHQPIAFLEALAGPLAGIRIEVDRSPFQIGADPACTLAIADDETLSGRHAQFRLERSILMLEDLDSTNGTWVNGVRLASGRVPLAPGDQLKLGASIFRVARL